MVEEDGTHPAFLTVVRVLKSEAPLVQEQCTRYSPKGTLLRSI